jgi:GMP synthase-like glutamine amidotransferase
MTVGILNAYQFDPRPDSYQQEYTRLMLGFVKKAFPDKKIKNFLVGQGEWPVDVNECEIWIITGSAKGAYDKDPWIEQLKYFIIDLHKNKRKTIGICFGHQLISAALGGEVMQSSKGWGVGVRTFQILDFEPWMKPHLEEVSLLFSHQDQVTKPPKGAKLLGQDAFCPFQMFQIGDHMLTLQGHPEYSVQFAKARLESRKDKVAPEVYKKAMNSFEDRKDDLVLASWIRNFALY